MAAAAQQLETLQHAFMECPAVKPALQWLERLWRRVSGQTPPHTAGTWLMGEEAGWSRLQLARGGDAFTWRTLRLTMLVTAWGLRCERRRSVRQFGPQEVIAAFAERVRQLVEADFQRCSDKMFDVSGACIQWFPHNSHRQIFGESGFEARWCCNNVIAQVMPAPPGTGGESRLRFRLTAASGAARPAAAVAAATAGGGGGGGSGGGDGGGGGVLTRRAATAAAAAAAGRA